MTRKGWETVALRTVLLDRLKTLYHEDKNRPVNQSFNAYFENLLLIQTDYHEKIMKHGGFFEYVGAFDNHINIYDQKLKTSIRVYIHDKEKKLYCEKHESNDCLHVGFCYAIPEVYNVLIERGFNPR